MRKISDALTDPDFAKAVLALRLAVMFMHSRIEVDLDEMRLKMKSRIELETRRDWIAQHPTVFYWMQKERECWGEVGVDFSIKTGALLVDVPPGDPARHPVHLSSPIVIHRGAAAIHRKQRDIRPCIHYLDPVAENKKPDLQQE